MEMACTFVNTSPNNKSHNAGWIARTIISVKSCRSLRTSSSAITNVLVDKPTQQRQRD